jgi:hypothetical protein
MDNIYIYFSTVTKCLLICLNILISESHWEPQTQISNFFKTELLKNNNEYDNSGIYGLNGNWRIKTNIELVELIKHRNIINYVKAQN